jgi:hypothetical protein
MKNYILGYLKFIVSRSVDQKTQQFSSPLKNFGFSIAYFLTNR